VTGDFCMLSGAQVNDVEVTPTLPTRGILLTQMLATLGWPGYPGGTQEKPFGADPVAVAQTLNWFAVRAGGLHTCAIRRYFNRSKHAGAPNSDFNHMSPDHAPGQLRCWGMNDYGQVDPVPQPLGEPAAEGEIVDAFGQ